MAKPMSKDAYELLHNGALALAKVEAAGMRMDANRLDALIEGADEKIKSMAAELKETEEWDIWKRRFGQKASLGSRQQLGVVLFEEMGHKIQVKTKTGRAKVDEEQLGNIDSRFVGMYLNVEKLKKLRSTYLIGIRREVCNGYLHPSFNLHLTRTRRSSSDSPNFQNIPIRDPKMGKPIRSCFIPRENHVLVEIDYSALEFRVCACFWRDNAMIEYASDPHLDVHRDMAAECYLIAADEVSKKTRFHAKNCFVFPTLYGSWFKNTSVNLWKAMEADGLTTNDDDLLIDRLADQGTTELNFEGHIEDVEEGFMSRFPQWTARKEKWWNKYLKTGKFRLMTGFQVEGVYSKNNLFNYPIQGPAFHILLWGLIRLVKWSSKKKTKITGQIHDSIVADVHLDELDEYLAKAKQVMTVDVRKHWPWIVTPLEIEVELAEDNWYNKKALKI